MRFKATRKWSIYINGLRSRRNRGGEGGNKKKGEKKGTGESQEPMGSWDSPVLPFFSHFFSLAGVVWERDAGYHI